MSLRGKGRTNLNNNKKEKYSRDIALVILLLLLLFFVVFPVGISSIGQRPWEPE